MPDSGTKQLGDVLKNGIYRIPDYQRGYAWTTKEVNDFVDDLEYVTENPSVDSHYVNSIIVTEQDENDLSEILHVIDGQQRLLTSSLVAHEILRKGRRIDTNGDQNADHTREQIEHLIYKDVYAGGPNQGQRRVLPAHEHQEVFRQIVPSGLEEERNLTAIAEKASTPSEEKLVEAAETISERLDAVLTEESGANGKLTHLSRLAKTLHKDFVSTLHKVQNPAEAGRIFEAINDRGRDLNRADKIKSYLVYRATLGDVGIPVEKIHETFTEVYEILNRFADDPGKVDSLVDRLIGQHWTMFAGEDQIGMPDDLVGRHEKATDNISQIKYARYHVPKEATDNRVGSWIRAYLDSLKRAAVAYIHVRGTGQEDLFHNFRQVLSENVDHREVRHCLYAVERFGRSTMHALLVALYERFGDTELYEPILESLEKLVVRVFGIGGARRDKNRSDFESLARVLFWAGRGDLEEVFPHLSSIPKSVQKDARKYGIDGDVQDAEQVIHHLEEWAYNYSHEESENEVVDTFERRLAEDHLEGLGVAGWSGVSPNELKNYLLYRYEIAIRKGGSDMRGYLDAGIYDYTVEHVWASGLSESEYPGELSEDQYEQHVERLGNLAFLSLSENASAKDAPYEQKWDRVYSKARDGTKMFREEFPVPPARREGGMNDNAAMQEGFDTWGTDVIEWRSERMARTLADYWGFDDSKYGARQQVLTLGANT